MIELTAAALSALFLSAFLSATLLPGGSELVFAATLHAQPDLAALAVAIATVGNTLGGMSTYAMARLLPRKELPPRLELVRSYGSLCLVLSWVPLIGDALCAAAGVLRLPWVSCLWWMAIGKGARYLAIAWAMQ